MSGLMLPEGYAPSNLHLTPSTKARYVESDVYDICHRLAAVNPCLYVVQLEGTSKRTGKRKAVWCVMERCVDGVSRIVCKLEELDARAVDKVQQMLSVPFWVRLKAIEEENDRWEAEFHQNELDRIYEQMGGQFWHQLEHDGFIQRPVSYPKIGVAAHGKRAR